MSFFKSFIKKLIEIDKNNFLFNFIIKNKTLVLLYHDVSYYPSNFSANHNLNVQPDIFEMQLSFISKYFNFISPKDYLENNYNEPSCLITFDDGFESYITTALPIMEKYRAPSIFFLNLEPTFENKALWSALICYLYENNDKFKYEIDHKYKNNTADYFLYVESNFVNNFISKNNLEKTIIKEAREYCGNFCNLNLLKKYQNHELVYYGNHLYNHFNSTNIDQIDLEKNFLINQKILDNFENGLNLFAYPFGQPNSCYNKTTNDILKKKTNHIFTSYHALNINKADEISHRISFDNNIKKNDDIKLSVFKGYIRNILSGKKNKYI